MPHAHGVVSFPDACDRHCVLDQVPSPTHAHRITLLTRNTVTAWIPRCWRSAQTCTLDRIAEIKLDRGPFFFVHLTVGFYGQWRDKTRRDDLLNGRPHVLGDIFVALTV